ncbi:MAG: helix-turn-helix domain-containing protein [Cyclobacteriaceae bacterium]
MNWRYVTVILLLSSANQCQAESDMRSDTVEVQQLIQTSKKYQWTNPDQSLRYADEALRLARELDYKKGIAIANTLKGFCFWTFGDNELAIESAMAALEIAQQETLTRTEAEGYYILARGYMDIAERKKAREAIEHAEALAQQGADWEQLCSIYNLKGVILFMADKPDSALFFYNKALEVGTTHGVDSINFPRIISNIGEVYAPENSKLAMSYYQRALLLAKNTGNKITEASITSIIGIAHLKANNLKGAEQTLQSALVLARELGLRRVIRQAYGGLVDVRLQQGKGDEAVVYLRKYYAVRDSLLNSAKIRQIVELEAKHDLQLKEQRIQVLNSEKQIQALWKNILLAALILLILLSIGGYVLQRYRYRKNREMLNLEIDYLTRQYKESEDKYKATLVPDSSEKLESHDQKLLKRAMLVVEDNISDPLFGVEKMASEMNMSRASLHRKIKSITGFPPSELIRSIRLRTAARLILNKVDSVSQIAIRVGFNDYSHFSKSFKKHFGVAPTSYEDQAAEQVSA